MPLRTWPPVYGLAAATGIAGLLLLAVGCSSRPTGDPASGPSRRVVAYVANVSPTGEFCRLPEGCQFRLIDPRTGGDEMVFPVADIPRNIFWDPGFTGVHFRLGTKLYHSAWQKGAQPAQVLELPEVLTRRAETIEDIWQDSTTKKWRIKSLEYEGEGAERRAIAGAWEFDTASGNWVVLDKEPTECECGDCPCAEIMNRWREPAPRVSAREAIENMGIEWHLERSRPGEDWKEGQYGFISQAFPNTNYEVRVVQGDHFHAFAPVKVDLGNGTEPQTVFTGGRPCGDQVAFQEEDGFLLLIAEYTGSCASIINLSNAQATASLPYSTISALWVNRPAQESR